MSFFTKKKQLDFDKLYKEYLSDAGSKTKAKHAALELIKGKETIQSNARLEEGHIYQYDYSPIHRDTLNYYDNKPLVLALGPSKKYKDLDLGINLNFLPPQYKYFLLKSVFKYNKNKIAKSFFRRKSRLVCNYDFLKKIVPDELKFAIRLYHRNNKKNVKPIEFDEWHIVSLLEIGDFYKITLSQIYKMWKKK
jgi:hypothetical protein